MLAAREGVMPELRQIGVLISPAENVDAVRSLRRGRPVQAVSGPDQGRVFTAAVREG